MKPWTSDELSLAGVDQMLHDSSLDEAAWRLFRESVEKRLTHVPDMYVDPRVEWRGLSGKRQVAGRGGRPPESTQCTRHILRAMDEYLPDNLIGNGRFVADVYLHDQIDRNVDYWKREAMSPHIGDAIIHTLTEAPMTIRRLLARIDQLEQALRKK